MRRFAAYLKRWPAAVGAGLFALYVGSQSTIAWLLGARLGADLVPMQLSFTKARFDAVVNLWTDAHLEQLRSHFYLDFIHPFIYALTLSWALANVLPPKRQRLVALPLVAAGCDLCENTLHARALFTDSFRALDQPAIALASGFAATKWLLALISVVLVLIYFVRNIRA